MIADFLVCLFSIERFCSIELCKTSDLSALLSSRSETQLSGERPWAAFKIYDGSPSKFADFYLLELAAYLGTAVELAG